MKDEDVTERYRSDSSKGPWKCGFCDTPVSTDINENVAIDLVIEKLKWKVVRTMGRHSHDKGRILSYWMCPNCWVSRGPLFKEK